MRLTGVTAILFDKDGTLFDFGASWNGWVARILSELSAGEPARAQAMASALAFDLRTGRLFPHSAVIAGTLEQTADLMLPALDGMGRAELIAYLMRASIQTEMVAPLPLHPLLTELRARGLTLGVATNDGEASALTHLDRAGIAGFFAQVLGYDSGYAPKPAPDMLLGFAERVQIAPARIVMVGDSTHDLIAGRAAGMKTVGVLTGLADRATLAPYADAVVADIGAVPRLLAAE
ncbi:MAG: HAD family hydrolase [Roseinatronobacter sp.]